MDVIIFIALLILFLGIGYRASTITTYDSTDYLVAGRSISPLLTALSASASKYSGYMFVGLVGYIYHYGLSSVWILLGFLFGDALAFYTLHQKVREESERIKATTFIGLISRWHHNDYTVLRLLLGLIALIFLMTYAAAQFSAGSKTLYAAFNWHHHTGATICAILIIAYCLKGGLRASIWTDAAQAIIMFIALTILLTSIVNASQGIGSFIHSLQQVSPSYLNLGTERFGSLGATALFALGWLFNGIGVSGQPHIMVRFMSLDSSEHMQRTGVYYFLWSTLFLLLILGVSLGARLFIDQSAMNDAEMALPTLSQQLLPSIASGLLIAAIFSAIISTADSLILSCSAIVSEDLSCNIHRHHKYLMTGGVSIIALCISLFAPSNVFTLVVFSWSALASSMGPLVIVQACGQRPPQWLAMTMVIGGLATALLWRLAGLSSHLYEALPGIMMGLTIFYMGRLVTPLRKR